MSSISNLYSRLHRSKNYRYDYSFCKSYSFLQLNYFLNDDIIFFIKKYIFFLSTNYKPIISCSIIYLFVFLFFSNIIICYNMFDCNFSFINSLKFVIEFNFGILNLPGFKNICSDFSLFLTYRNMKSLISCLIELYIFLLVVIIFVAVGVVSFFK